MCQLDPDQLPFVEKRIRRIRSAELETSIGSFFIYLYFSLGQLSFDLSPQSRAVSGSQDKHWQQVESIADGGPKR
jgi:hypothetical protein